MYIKKIRNRRTKAVRLKRNTTKKVEKKSLEFHFQKPKYIFKLAAIFSYKKITITKKEHFQYIVSISYI